MNSVFSIDLDVPLGYAVCSRQHLLARGRENFCKGRTPPLGEGQRVQTKSNSIASASQWRMMPRVWSAQSLLLISQILPKGSLEYNLK